jgi:hypothetical protein
MTLTQQIEPYQEPQAAKVLSFNQNYRKTYLGYDDLKRANPPDNPTGITSVIGEQAKKVVSVVSQKLKRLDIFICNLKYISKVTKRKSRQSLNIINEIKGTVFKIEFYKKYEYKEKIYKNCYVFELLKKEENKLNIRKPYSQNDASSQSLQTSKHKGSEKSSFYNNIKRNRSNESNVLNDSFSSSEDKIKTSKPPKIRKLFFNQYDKPKTLAEESPINDQEEAEVYKLSGRMYEKEAMNEILKDMVKRSLQKLFYSRRQFIVWFSKCMLNELRSVEHTSKKGFYIKGSKTKAEIVEHTTMQERERYLNKIETDAIHHRSDETQLKAKWAGRLAPSTAYNLLKNLSYWRIVGGVMEIYLQKGMDMLEMQKKVLLSQIQAVGAYQEVKEFKLIVENK